jgi:hypothetical protein
MVPHKIVTLVFFTKMVYLDTNYKHMGWYGHDFLYVFGYFIFLYLF